MGRSKKIGKAHPITGAMIYNDGTIDGRYFYSGGYKVYTGKKGRGLGTYLLHRHVAELFIPNPEKKPLVNHKDGKKYNAKASNLEWATQSDNVVHAYKSGLMRKSKFTPDQVKLIRKSKELKETLAHKYNTSARYISMIQKKIVWKNIK